MERLAKNVLKVALGAILGLMLFVGFAVFSFMPPTHPDQTLYRAVANQPDIIKSGKYPPGEKARPYNYSLAFVELDDDGLFVEPSQVDRLLLDLKNKISQRDTTILLYVHGWNHNAGTDDSNVACFDELLKATAIMQSAYASSDGKSPRAVYGIYVGWPGVIYNNEALNKALTFFGRQSAADRIGERGPLLELFTRIGSLRDTQKPQRTKFVIVSHSLGARLTYKALRPVMQYSAYESSGKASYLADVVVMANPALSADEHTALARLIQAQARQRDSPMHPKFIIATSKSDEVLDGVFPFSQRLSSFVRGDYMLGNDSRAVPIGLYGEYVTHALELKGQYENSPGANACPTLQHDELEIVKARSRARDPAELYDYKTVRHYDSNGKEIYRTELTEAKNPSHGPIMVVEVSGDIIPNHNDIFTSPFVDFVSRAINAGLYRSQ